MTMNPRRPSLLPTHRRDHLPSHSSFNRVATSLLFVFLLLHSTHYVHAQEVDIPIDYKAVAGKKANKCVHEEFINHRICTQESAKISETVCKDEYFALIGDTEQVSDTCGGGSKFECEDVRTICQEITKPRPERVRTFFKYFSSLSFFFQYVLGTVLTSLKIIILFLYFLYFKVPCCVCMPVEVTIKTWKCGATQHTGKITQNIIDFCHPSLNYDGNEFRQAIDDDVLPGAGYCDNNFAAGKNVLYQFYCDENTGSLQCGGGNRGHGRSFVLDNNGTSYRLSLWIVTLVNLIWIASLL